MVSASFDETRATAGGDQLSQTTQTFCYRLFTLLKQLLIMHDGTCKLVGFLTSSVVRSTLRPGGKRNKSTMDLEIDGVRIHSLSAAVFSFGTSTTCVGVECDLVNWCAHAIYLFTDCKQLYQD